MTGALPQGVADLLDEATTMTVATRDELGVWAAPVFFAVAGSSLLFVSSESSRHCSEAALACAVAFSIFPASASWAELRGIQGSGRVDAVAAADRDTARTTYLDRFAEIRAIVEAPADAQQQRVREAFLRSAIYRLRPDRLRLIDNRQGFAARTEYRLVDASWVARA